MKFSSKFSVIVGLFMLALFSSQVSAQENLSLKGLKFSLGAGLTTAGGTSTTTGSGVYTDAGSALVAASAGNYVISSSSSFKPSNFIGRVELGYDWAVKERGILGLSLSKDFKSTDASANLGSTLTVNGACTVGTCASSVSFRDSPSVVMDGPYALALRAGYATTKDSMLYTKLFYARSKVSGTFADTAHGVGLGLGFESNLSDHWFMRGELETIRYSSFDVTTTFADSFVGSVTDHIKLRSNSARVLIGVRF